MKHAIRHSTHRRSQAHSVTIKRNQAYEPILHLLRRIEVDPKRRHLGAHRPFEFRPWQVLHREHALRAEMMVSHLMRGHSRTIRRNQMMVSHLMRYVLGCQIVQQSEAIGRNRAQSDAIGRNHRHRDAIRIARHDGAEDGIEIPELLPVIELERELCLEFTEGG